MKKILSVLFVLALLCALAVPAMAEEGSVSILLRTETHQLNQGETFEVEFLVGMEGKCDAYGYYLELDPALLTVESYEILDTNRVQFAAFDEKGLAVAYGMPQSPKDVVCKAVLRVSEDAPLGELVLEGKAAAMLADKTLTATSGGIKVQVNCNHSYNGWHQTDEETHTGECTKCGHVEVTGHNWDTGAMLVTPTCTETGKAVYVCVDCRQVHVAEAPAEHSYDNACDADCNLCGAERSIEHLYAESWEADAEGHYHSCTLCGSISTKEKHSKDRDAATADLPVRCKTCSYIITPALNHTHSYGATLLSDATGHWYGCIGCMEKKDLQSHSFDNDCDTLCDACGYTRQIRHQPGTDWHSDEDTHYRLCKTCGEKVEVLYHAPGDPATEFEPRRCMVCQNELSPALGHTMSEEWYFDEQTHFHQCACGATADAEPHRWSEKGEGGFVTCTVCGTKTEAVPMFVWIALGVAGLVAVALIIVVIVRKSSRKEDEEEDADEESSEEENAEEVETV